MRQVSVKVLPMLAIHLWRSLSLKLVHHQVITPSSVEEKHSTGVLTLPSGLFAPEGHDGCPFEGSLLSSRRPIRGLATAGHSGPSIGGQHQSLSRPHRLFWQLSALVTWHSNKSSSVHAVVLSLMWNFSRQHIHSAVLWWRMEDGK